MTRDPIYVYIGALIKARRKTLKQKQETLAKTLGISRGSLANIETGKQSMLIHQLYRFANALELSPFDLLPAPETTENVDLPLPDDLKGKQKAQVANFFSLIGTNATRDKEDVNGKTTKR